MTLFTVYVETNWLVSCVLPHHDWRTQAVEILDEAEKGNCLLRIPKVAFVEARHVVERETQDHAKAVSAVASSLQAAGRNLDRSELAEMAKALKDAEQSYHLHNPREELQRLINRTEKFGFQHPSEEQVEFDRLRPLVASMRGGDVVDLYILSAISADRSITPDVPAAVLSANSNEFSVVGNKRKLPADFYTSRKMIYNDKFNLQGARKAWTKASGDGWPLPRQPRIDDRVKQAHAIIDRLAEDKRDDALSALQKLA